MKMTSKCLLAGLLLCALMAAASAQDAKIAVLIRAAILLHTPGSHDSQTCWSGW
jgi:hypothetical protein